MSSASGSMFRNLIAAVRRQLDVVLHAAAGVEQQAEVQSAGRRSIVAAREVGDRLRLAVLEDLEVVAR